MMYASGLKSLGIDVSEVAATPGIKVLLAEIEELVSSGEASEIFGAVYGIELTSDPSQKILKNMALAFSTRKNLEDTFNRSRLKLFFDIHLLGGEQAHCDALDSIFASAAELNLQVGTSLSTAKQVVDSFQKWWASYDWRARSILPELPRHKTS